MKSFLCFHVPRTSLCVRYQFGQNFGVTLFDQFGIIPSTCANTWDLLLLPQPLACGIAQNDLAFTMAAFTSTTVAYRWIWTLDHCCFCIKGEAPAPLVIQEALLNALDKGSLALMHRLFTCDSSEEGITCVFAPVSSHGVAPEGAFRLDLAIGLSRTLSVLGIGLFPYTLDFRLNLVNKGKRCNPDHLVSDFLESTHCGAILFHVVPCLQGGGPGSKNQQRMLQQTALASVLLEHGYDYDLPWTTKTCDTLLAKFSLAKIQAITAQPMSGEKLRAVHQLCKEADIALPDISKPSSKVVSAITPWSNAKKAKRSQVQLDPRDFSICQGFFLNADGPPASQLQELRPQATGVVLASTQQAQSWIKEGQLISSDELGLLILGTVPETSLPFVEVTFPCKNTNEQMVLLTAKLIQLGSKPIGFLKGPDKKIDAESCSLIAITLCKEDWDQDSWNDALHNTQSFLRRVLSQENQGESVLAM